MLGSNQKNTCDVEPPTINKSCIEIRDWNSLPQSKGCVKYKGKYYVNLVIGNTTLPDQGVLSGTYAVGSEDYCQVIKYFATNQTTCDMSNTFMKFFTGIGEYSQCTEDKVFVCDEFIIFKNNNVYELHQSLIDNNTRHPHDRDAWKNLGDFSNILNLIFDESEGYQLTLPYWEDCAGKNCATIYKKCSLVVEKIDSGEVDNCGNPIFNELIFESLIDKNTDRPSLGAVKPIPTWKGPFTDSEFINRHIGKTVNDDKIKSGTDVQLVTSIDFCDKFQWIDVPSGKFDGNDQPILVKLLCSKPIGTDQNDKIIDLDSNSKLLSTISPSDKFEWIKTESGDCEDDCEPVLINQFDPKPIGKDQNDNTIVNGGEHVLLSKSSVCDKFEWVETESGICEDDCEPVLINQFCPKPIGSDENCKVIESGSCTKLISFDAPIEPLIWVDDPSGELRECGGPKQRLGFDVSVLPDGPQGPQGVAGQDGNDGAVGPQGPQGVAGQDGNDGAVGPQGPQGVAGQDGNDGQGISLNSICTGNTLSDGSSVVDLGNPVSSGGIWIGGKTQTGGSTPITTGEHHLDYTESVIYGGHGSPVSVSDSGINVLKAGVFLPSGVRFAVTDACNDAGADQNSTYQLELFVNGTTHNKVDFTLSGVVDVNGVSEGISANKPMKPIIAVIGDVITGIVTVESGNGGHCIASTQMLLQYDGCGQQY